MTRAHLAFLLLMLCTSLLAATTLAAGFLSGRQPVPDGGAIIMLVLNVAMMYWITEHDKQELR